ncbi:hypothetical protein [Amycolatopsis rubida]|uniref:hypothetical protein n=1 Tax=Amycolatopsis rubida TaxID=112413 RepID=UPI001FCAB159|nr:hypothetical protein [Amycolatopsis rubida]
MVDADETVAEVQALGAKALAVRTDVSVQNVVTAAVEAFGSLDFARNNAGTSPPVS